MKTVYVSIGNSDDKLTQKEWSEFYSNVSMQVSSNNSIVHGQWVSVAFSQWQNACWCFDIKEERIDLMKRNLSVLAHRYQQDSIAWVEVDETEHIEAAKL